MALFRPIIDSQQGHLHFLVTPLRNNLSLFDQSSIMRHIKKVLEFDNVIVEDETTLDASAKPHIIGSRCPLSENNVDQIRHFCSTQLLIAPNININSQTQADGKVTMIVEFQSNQMLTSNQDQYIAHATELFRENLQNALLKAHPEGVKPGA